MTDAPFLLNDAKMQSDLDCNFFRLLNLDTSNLPPTGIPPTIHPNGSFWLHDWDATTQQWTATQPKFTDINGFLTFEQQQAIFYLGTIQTGTWHGLPIEPAYAPSLDAILPPGANVSMANNRITQLAMPVNASDAVPMQFVDFIAEGLQPHQACRVATVSAVVLSGLQIIDGVQTVDGDRILVKNQALVESPQNGIWIAHTGAWTRASDNTNGSTGTLDRAYVIILEGDTNSFKGWFQFEVGVVIGSGNIGWFLFSSALNFSAGAGLDLTGNVLSAVGTAHRITVGSSIDIASDYQGQGTIVEVGTITLGNWHGTIIIPDFGGTGVDNNGNTISVAGDLSLTIPPLSGPSSLELQILSGATVVALPQSGTLSTLANAETLSNKYVQPRMHSVATGAFPAINTDITDIFLITALNLAISSMTFNLTGSPDEGQQLLIQIHDNGTQQSILWGSKFTNGSGTNDPVLPVVTIAGKWTFMEFHYNKALGQWVLTNMVAQI